MSVYEQIGVRRVVNCLGYWTRIGGSVWSQKAIDAILDANSWYVEMAELEACAGKIIADLVGAEAGYVTSGAFCALMLSVAACMTGNDPDKIGKLPDTTTMMKKEVVHQRCLRYKYDRAITAAGAKMVLVGDDDGCNSSQMEAAIDERTAAILYEAPGRNDAVPIDKVIEIGARHKVPVVVDAPGNIYGSEMWVPKGIYPDEGYKDYIEMGADLLCCGGKYVGAPQSVGYVVGKKALIEAIALNDFVGYENPTDLYRSLGRGCKIDRQLIVGLVIALQEWKKMDHGLRLKSAYKKKRYLMESIATLPNITLSDVPDSTIMVGFEIVLEKKNSTETAQIINRLLQGNPRIEVFYHSEGLARGRVRSTANSFIINVICMQDDDERIVANRLRSELSADHQG